MKQLTFVSLVVLLLIGCRKDIQQDRLDGGAANYIGKWEWVYSLEEIVGDGPPSTYETHTPTTAGFSFQIEFLEEGIAILSRNEIELGRYRMDFRSATASSSGGEIYGALYRVIEDEAILFSASYQPSTLNTMEFWYLPLNLSGNDGNIFKRIQ